MHASNGKINFQRSGRIFLSTLRWISFSSCYSLGALRECAECAFGTMFGALHVKQLSELVGYRRGPNAPIV